MEPRLDSGYTEVNNGDALLEQGTGQAALTDDSAQSAAVELTMQRNRKRHPAASHYDMTAALLYAFEAVFS
jgi:hypothetical protein